MSLVAPKLYPMVDLDGLDLAEVDGTRAPGIYNKISSNLIQDNIEIFYNWYFANIILAPYRVSIDTTTPNQFLINGVILVKSDDTVSITGHIYIPVIESLSVTENGTYNVPSGVDGFGPVVVDVPSVPPVLVELNVTENGTFTPTIGVDGFNSVVVNVPDIPPVLEQLSVTENGTYTPPSGTDGYDEVVVNVPDIPPVLDQLSVTENGTQTPPTGTDGYNEVVVNVPTGPSFVPLHYDMNAGYLSSGSYHYGSGSISDVYQAIAGHAYCVILGTPVGNRFRAAFFNDDPYTFTTNVTGTVIGTDVSSPAAYAYKAVFTAPRNGYIMIMKSNAAQTGCKSFCFDLTALSAQ